MSARRVRARRVRARRVRARRVRAGRVRARMRSRRERARMRAPRERARRVVVEGAAEGRGSWAHQPEEARRGGRRAQPRGEGAQLPLVLGDGAWLGLGLG